MSYLNGLPTNFGGEAYSQFSCSSGDNDKKSEPDTSILEASARILGIFKIKPKKYVPSDTKVVESESNAICRLAGAIYPPVDSSITDDEDDVRFEKVCKKVSHVINVINLFRNAMIQSISEANEKISQKEPWMTTEARFPSGEVLAEQIEVQLDEVIDTFKRTQQKYNDSHSSDQSSYINGKSFLDQLCLFELGNRRFVVQSRNSDLKMFELGEIIGKGTYGSAIGVHKIINYAVDEKISRVIKIAPLHGDLGQLEHEYEILHRIHQGGRVKGIQPTPKAFLNVFNFDKEWRKGYFTTPYLPLDEIDFSDCEFNIKLNLVLDLMQATLELHNKNVFHSDIKPSNIGLLEDQPELILVDFGGARYANEVNGLAVLGAHTALYTHDKDELEAKKIQDAYRVRLLPGNKVQDSDQLHNPINKLPPKLEKRAQDLCRRHDAYAATVTALEIFSGINLQDCCFEGMSNGEILNEMLGSLDKENPALAAKFHSILLAEPAGRATVKIVMDVLQLESCRESATSSSSSSQG